MSESKSKQELIEEIEALKQTLRTRETTIQSLLEKDQAPSKHCLTNEEITRYSRQMFLDLVAVSGQEKLKASSVLVVGCGGLGCPAAQYLASVGIGVIGLVDYDEVELNNLHRQVLHSEETIGTAKVDSLASAITRLNSNTKVNKYKIQLSSSNALGIVKNYDIILDACDNVATRYLLNDACLLSGVSALISGAAVKTEAQITVYGYQGGPCYRCLFPQPPPPHSVSNCGDVGVLPQVPGVIGVLQALQAVHIILNNKCGVLSGRMLLFDAESTEFRSVILRNRSPSCQLCGDKPSITSLLDYELFCGSPANDKERGVKLLGRSDRITAVDLKRDLTEKASGSLLIDVRSNVEFAMCRIPSSINIPLDSINPESQLVPTLLKQHSPDKVYVICRRGNDSQLAVAKLKQLYPDAVFQDVLGGLHSWAKLVDPYFPVY